MVKVCNLQKDFLNCMVLSIYVGTIPADCNFSSFHLWLHLQPLTFFFCPFIERNNNFLRLDYEAILTKTPQWKTFNTSSFFSFSCSFFISSNCNSARSNGIGWPIIVFSLFRETCGKLQFGYQWLSFFTDIVFSHTFILLRFCILSQSSREFTSISLGDDVLLTRILFTNLVGSIQHIKHHILSSDMLVFEGF